MFSKLEAEDMETAVKTVMQVSSWLDWWLVAVEVICISPLSMDAKEMQHFLVAEVQAIVFLVKALATSWT